jgi:hypothetical protein
MRMDVRQLRAPVMAGYYRSPQLVRKQYRLNQRHGVVSRSAPYLEDLHRCPIGRHLSLKWAHPFGSIEMMP